MQMESQKPDLPEWVPETVARYVAHTEHGVPIRELARREGCHASTILRQIRRMETLRDDPPIDAALERFRTGEDAEDKETEAASDEGLRREARRILPRLCESGAVLAVARAAGETAPLLFTCSIFQLGAVTTDPTKALPNIPVLIFTY